jgi:hypothetical protein
MMRSGGSPVRVTVVYEPSGTIVSLGWPGPAGEAPEAPRSLRARIPAPTFGAEPGPGQSVATLEVPAALADLGPLELHRRCRVEPGPDGPRLVPRAEPGAHS